MPQFCILFYANYTILATQRGGGNGPMPPLNTPLFTTKKLGSITKNEILLPTMPRLNAKQAKLSATQNFNTCHNP